MNTNSLFNKGRERRAVAPIIATLLMVAIAVVGGILIFVFAQGFFSSSQVEGPAIESVTMLGYDTRDVAQVENHASRLFDVGLTAGSTTDNRLSEGDKVTFYVKNTGTQPLVLNTVKLAGEELTFEGTDITNSTGLGTGEYGVLDGNDVDTLLTTPVINAGQETTVIASVVDSPLKTGRTYAFEITTGNGATFKFDFIAGINKG